MSDFKAEMHRERDREGKRRGRGVATGQPPIF